MSFEPVDMYITESTPPNAPLEGVVVKIYDPTGAMFFTQGVTDAAGHVGFLLETQSYSARFYKFQVQFSQPQVIVVLPLPAINVFDVVGTSFAPPAATDPRLCRASGFFRDVTGSPKPWLDMHFISKFSPILLDGSGVVSERQTTRTDETGYVQLDLIRCAQYAVTIQDFEDTQRQINVPDSPKVNLPDLLFPAVASITFDPPPPYFLTIGTDLVVTPTVVTTDGRTLIGCAIDDVRWGSSDNNVAVVLPSQTTLALRGLTTGIAQITAVRLDATVIRIPNTPISGVPVDMTVS